MVISSRAAPPGLTLDLEPVGRELAAQLILGDQELTIDLGLAQRPHRLDAREERIEPPALPGGTALDLEIGDIDLVGHDPDMPAGEGLRWYFRDDDIVMLSIDVVDAVQGGREVLEGDLLPDQPLPSRREDRGIQVDIRRGLELHRPEGEARFRKLLRCYAGNGLAELAAERALSRRRRGELLPHDGVLIDRSLKRDQRKALRLGRLEREQLGQQHQGDENEDRCSPLGTPVAIRDCTAARRQKRIGSYHAGHPNGIRQIMLSGTPTVSLSRSMRTRTTVLDWNAKMSLAGRLLAPELQFPPTSDL
jgi:hypothetical protein